MRPHVGTGKQVPGIGVFGVNLKGGAVEAFGGVEVPATMVLETELERVVGEGHGSGARGYTEPRTWNAAEHCTGLSRQETGAAPANRRQRLVHSGVPNLM